MQDDLRWNKLFGAILATALGIMVLRQASEMVFAAPKEMPAKPGYAIAVQEESAGGAEPADVAPDWGTVLPTADVAAGATVSTKCQSCHTLTNGGPNQTGPNLWGVIGRKPGSHPGFAYSGAMTAEGGKIPVWDYAHIYEFLKSPSAYVPGTKMSFVGLKKREDRINLIAWLRQQSSSPVAIPPADPKAAAAAAAPAGATGSAPQPNTATTVPAKDGSASAATAVDGKPPVNAESATGAAPTSGAAAAPTQEKSNPGGPQPSSNGGKHNLPTAKP